MATENPSTNSDLELAMAKAEVARLKETLKEDVNLWSSTKVLLNDLILQVEKNAEVVESKFSACLQSLEALKEQVQDISSRVGFITSPVNARSTAVISDCDKKEKDLPPFTTSPFVSESATAVVLEKKEKDLSPFTTSPFVSESATAVVLEKKEKDTTSPCVSESATAEKKEKDLSPFTTLPSVNESATAVFSEKEPSVKDKCEQVNAYSLTSEAVMTDSDDSSSDQLSDKELEYMDVNWYRWRRNVKREWDKVKKARRISANLRKKKGVTEQFYLSGYIGSSSRQTTEKLDSEVSESEADEVSMKKKRRSRQKASKKFVQKKNKHILP